MKNLREIRKKKGWTMKKLAEEVDMSPRSIFRYEHGLRKPNIYAALIIACALDTDVETLLGDEVRGIKK